MKRRSNANATTWLIRAAILLTCLRVGFGPEPWEPQAQAQIPNPGLQRIKLLKEQQRTNELLEQIKQRLETGVFNVHVRGADKHSNPTER